MPLLARMLAAPLVIDVRPGAIAGLRGLLADGRIAPHGRVAIVVGPGQGDEIAAELRLGESRPGSRPVGSPPGAPGNGGGDGGDHDGQGGAELFAVADGSYDCAVELGTRLRAAASFEAVAAIGGGRTIDVTKLAAHMAGLPMVSVATNLAHDGIASPVSTLTHESGTGSYGVVPPVAVVVDLDRVRRAPGALATAGIGDVVSNLSAVADWELSAADTGEPVDGLAVAMARAGAHAVLYQPGPAHTDEFLTVLAEALILSGMAMAVAGSSRPSSGGDHEIMHAINQLYPGTASHGELAGIGGLFCAHLREDGEQFAAVSSCLARYGMPRLPADVGLSTEQFVAAVCLAPATRPGRYTILERLAMSSAEAAKRVEEYERAVAG